MRIKLFENFSLLEANRNKIEEVENLFEEDLLKQEFIHEIFGKNDFTWQDDYGMDRDTQRSPSGLETIVWIEINNPSEKAMEAINSDYDKFAQPFNEWAKKHELSDPEIMTTENTMSFKITL